MEQKFFFDTPTQVCFWDADGNHWLSGIGYRDEIICGCCGGVIEIADIVEFAPEEIGDPIRVFDFWVDLTAEIAGDGWPENPFAEESCPTDEEMCEMEAYYFKNLEDSEG